MKKMHALILFTLGISGVYADAEEAISTDSELIAASVNRMAMSQDCSQLSADQQNFAGQLQPANQSMFCNQFNNEQRKNAMNMKGSPGNAGTPMTADQSVEQVAKQNNMTAPPSTQSGGQRRSCPMRNQ